MTRARKLLVWLIAVHVVLHAITLWLMLNDPRPTGWLLDAIVYPLFMLGPSQGALLALWVALGDDGVLRRLVATILGVVLYCWLFRNVEREWLDLTIGQLALLGTAMLLARLAGLKIAVRVKVSVPRRLQFSIRDMLIWNTATAIILSALRCLPIESLGRGPIRELAPFVSLALVAVAAILLTLGSGWTG